MFQVFKLLLIFIVYNESYFYFVVGASSISVLLPRARISLTQLPLLYSEMEMISEREKKDLILDRVQYDGALVDSNLLTKARDSLDSTKSAEAVAAALKVIQRFCLQLDRSDGRPDISMQATAQKFYDFTSCCLRASVDKQYSGSWTAVLGPFDYIGLKFNSFVITDSVKRVDIESFTKKICTVLLDLADEASRNAALSDPRNMISYLNLSTVLVRILLRYAIFQTNLESVGDSENGDTKIISIPLPCMKDVGHFPIEILETILCVDFNVPYSRDDKSLVVESSAIEAWANANKI